MRYLFLLSASFAALSTVAACSSAQLTRIDDAPPIQSSTPSNDHAPSALRDAASPSHPEDSASSVRTPPYDNGPTNTKPACPLVDCIAIYDQTPTAIGTTVVTADFNASDQPKTEPPTVGVTVATNLVNGFGGVQLEARMAARLSTGIPIQGAIADVTAIGGPFFGGVQSLALYVNPAFKPTDAILPSKDVGILGIGSSSVNGEPITITIESNDRIGVARSSGATTSATIGARIAVGKTTLRIARIVPASQSRPGWIEVEP